MSGRREARPQRRARTCAGDGKKRAKEKAHRSQPATGCSGGPERLSGACRSALGDQGRRGPKKRPSPTSIKDPTAAPARPVEAGARDRAAGESRLRPPWGVLGRSIGTPPGSGGASVKGKARAHGDLRPASLGVRDGLPKVRLARTMKAPSPDPGQGRDQTPRHQRRIAFCACSRFSASSKTTDCGPSITASVTSSLRCAGRQCMNSASGLACAISASFTW